jgi:hypothetical protein
VEIIPSKLLWQLQVTDVALITKYSQLFVQIKRKTTQLSSGALVWVVWKCSLVLKVWIPGVNIKKLSKIMTKHTLLAYFSIGSNQILADIKLL